MAHPRILSFKYALSGIYQAFKEEPNLKIHFLIAGVVLIANFYYKVTKTDWILSLLLIGLVLTAELTNTSLETVVDSFTNEHHPGAKKAKDVSAAAVLIVTITSVVVGILIYLPYFI